MGVGILQFFDSKATVDTNRLTTIVQTNENRPDLSLPLARVGQIVPYVIGRYLLS